MALPPRDVPEDLNAEEYYRLGIQYKQIGWTEQARDALNFAIELGKDTLIAVRAERFMRTKIPRFPVPLYAEQRNIEGFNLMSKPSEAKKIFEQLIEDFPDFEWPYGNLSVILMQEGDTSKAKELLGKALSINAYYVNGWIHMATALGLELDFKGAQDCVNKALDADPNDAAAIAFNDALQKLTGGFL